MVDQHDQDASEAGSFKPPRPPAPPPRREEAIIDRYAEADDAARTVIPGDPREIAEETAEIGPEGLPGDPKSGPNRIIAEIIIGFVIVALFAVVLGWAMGPVAGLLALIFGVLGLVINPVVNAATARASDRAKVVERHTHTITTPTKNPRERSGV